jgi:putative intracellular protease/amidase
VRVAYLYVLDTLSDWEPGYAIAELNSGQYFKERGKTVPVKMVGATKEPIKTRGGMTIIPDVTPAEITVENTDVLMLPGADTWPDPRHVEIVNKTKELLDAGANVAAICGATAVLANAGLLDERAHTSNAPQYPELMRSIFEKLPYFRGYKGQAYFKDDRAVADGNLITASSAGPLLWARLIFDRLGVFSDEALEAWYKYFETGSSMYFFDLMKALPED